MRVKRYHVRDHEAPTLSGMSRKGRIMSAAEDLQNAPDDFALLGLNREFQLDAVRLDTAVARVSNEISASGGDHAAELRQRLQAVRERLADPVRRAGYLLDLLAGPSDAGADGVPDTLKALEHQADSALDPAAVSAVRSALLSERQSRLDHIATNFSFPRNVPNENVQWNRDSAVRNDLSAVAVIDRLLEQLPARGQ